MNRTLLMVKKLEKFIEWSSLYQMYNRLLEKKVIDSEPMNLKKVLAQIAKVLPKRNQSHDGDSAYLTLFRILYFALTQI